METTGLGSGADHGFSPQDLQSAYRLPSVTAGSGQTVAIVDAYDDPNAQADLNVYRATYDLPPCEAGCLSKVNQEGGTTYPAANPGWALEISLDLDMVSAVCPKCHILLVEANSNSFANLGAAENEAAKLGATEISNSYGGSEIEVGEKLTKEWGEKYYTHSGIPITVASGDYGYEHAQYTRTEEGKCVDCSPNFPAGLSSVIAVGGTTLEPVGEAERGWSEQVWRYSGSGCTRYITKPAWQNDKGCKDRTDNDIAAVASGVSVYDTYAITPPGWQTIAGTSVSTPLTASAIALESGTMRSEGVEGIYKHPANWYDVTEGTNFWETPGVECKEIYLCHGEVGYDGPTGIGTPDGGATATPPSAYTEAASEVTTTTATLDGTVDAEASEAKYYFQYGRSVSYGSEVPFGGAKITGYTKPDAVTQNISSLRPQTEYHYRVVATSAAGTIYGADRVFWTAPKPYRSTFGSKGTAEGDFEGPQFTALNGEGDLWVSDYTNNRVEEFSPSGKFIKSCGKAGSGEDQFKGPTGIAIGSNEELYISDSGNDRIEAISQSCSYIETLGQGELSDPMGLALSVSSAEFSITVVLVANAGGDDIAVLEPGNPKLVGTYGSKGSGEGQFMNPTDVAFGGEEEEYADAFYVVDSGNNRVQKFTVGGLTYGGKATFKLDDTFGSSGSEVGKFSGPTAVALDPSTGDLDVTDTGNKRVQEFLPNGTYVAKFGGAGTGAEAFERPLGISVDASGDVYIADATNNRVDIWSTPEWRDQSTPNGPASADEESVGDEPYSVLSGASCTSWTTCEAVGIYQSQSNEGSAPLAEVRRNGDEWSRQTVPIPSGTIGELDNISCVSAGACAAVGRYGKEAKALGAEWNGSEWVSQAAAAPTGAKSSYLEGISCTTATACTAVGTYETGAGVATALAETWNGTKWTVQTTAKLPAETKKSHFYSISCTSSTACTAVGTVNIEESKAEVHHVLVERWNGTEWTLQLTAPEGYLYSVSCAAEKECMAVGEGAGKASGALGEHWNGTEWTSQSMVQAESGTASLYGVSCGSATSCVAVGRVTTPARPIAEQWNGKEWALQSTERLEASEHSGLYSVACIASGKCLAVGYAYAKRGELENPITVAEVNTSEQATATRLPVAKTEAASAVEQTKATLHGSVDPEGLATKYHFEYGTSTSYGSSTSEASAGEGTTSVPESAGIVSLVAGTTYHYRIVATNSAGTSYGADMTFTTDAPAFVPAKGAGAFPVAFTTSGGKTILEGAAGTKFECTSEAGTGTFTSAKEAKATLKFSGCTVEGIKCGTEGEIETKELKGLPVYTYPSKETAEGREAGLVLSPASGAVFAEFTCSFIKAVVRGSVIDVLTPLQKLTKTFALTIKQTKGVQEPSEYETETGGKKAIGLTCGSSSEAGEKCGIEEVTPKITLTSEEGAIGE